MRSLSGSDSRLLVAGDPDHCLASARGRAGLLFYPTDTGGRQPVTVILPERTLSQLAVINAGRARAIVKINDAVAGKGRRPLRPLELAEMAPGQSLIVVGASQALKRIPWLKLIEIAPAR